MMNLHEDLLSRETATRQNYRQKNQFWFIDGCPIVELDHRRVRVGLYYKPVVNQYWVRQTPQDKTSTCTLKNANWLQYTSIYLSDSDKYLRYDIWNDNDILIILYSFSDCVYDYSHSQLRAADSREANDRTRSLTNEAYK